MNPVDLSDLDAEVIYNSLYDDDDDPSHLIQDVAALKLSDGTFIDVSWYPQFDPAGAYTVARYSADFADRLRAVRTRRADAVPGVIRMMAHEAKAPAGARNSEV